MVTRAGICARAGVGGGMNTPKSPFTTCVPHIDIMCTHYVTTSYPRRHIWETRLVMSYLSFAIDIHLYLVSFTPGTKQGPTTNILVC